MKKIALFTVSFLLGALCLHIAEKPKTVHAFQGELQQQYILLVDDGRGRPRFQVWKNTSGSMIDVTGWSQVASGTNPTSFTDTEPNGFSTFTQVNSEP